MASRAINNMKNPDMDKPDRLVAKKENVVRDSDDPMFNIECEDYTEDMKEC